MPFLVAVAVAVILALALPGLVISNLSHDCDNDPHECFPIMLGDGLRFWIYGSIIAGTAWVAWKIYSETARKAREAEHVRQQVEQAAHERSIEKQRLAKAAHDEEERLRVEREADQSIQSIFQ